MYVAVKGGERAIENSHSLLAETRRGDPGVPELSVKQIQQQMGLAVARVMTEGSLYDPELAALAIKQAQGDLVEAVQSDAAHKWGHVAQRLVHLVVEAHAVGVVSQHEEG